MKPAKRSRWWLSACGIAILFYCLLVLGFVGTSPDLGLRFLLVDHPPTDGLTIQAVMPGLNYRGGQKPREGDVLLALGPSREPGRRLEPVTSFMHFTRRLVALRGETPFDGKLPANSDVSEFEDRIPPLAEIEAERWMDRERWVEIEFRRPGEAGTIKTWLQIHPIPFSDTLLTFVWFLLNLGIFSVGALAFWTRPFDRPARLFFAMCIVTLGAFVGGYHWWVIASRLWLSIPFCICAILLPVVLLHFFLVYPRPKQLMAQHPRLMLAVLYTVPLAIMAALLSLMIYCSWLYHRDVPQPELMTALVWLRNCVHVSLAVAGLYYLATLVALVSSFFTTRNSIEHAQVKWILWAGLFSTLPVGYTFYLAQFMRVEFAMGQGTIPMFIASLLFMLAYAVGILRYKLMLSDQIFSREVLYFVASFGATAVYSLTIALCSLISIHQNMRTSRDALVVAATLMVGVILLAWLRDRFQRIIDRRFFREKYQLDKALQRMNQTVGQLAEPEMLARRMLGSCRDVLIVDRAALYLRDPEKNVLRLLASEGDGKFPLQFPADEELQQTLLGSSTLQRVNTPARDGLSPVQQRLRELDADLVHTLEIDGAVAGVVLLGPKRSAAPYTAEDLTFLTAMGQVTSVALQSAKVHQALGRLNDELRMKVDKIAEQQRQIAILQAEIMSRQEPVPAKEADTFRRDPIKGSSRAIQQVLETVRKVSDSQSSVLIRGESGTGKELLAQALHENSPRRDGPMIRVHCGALAPGVLESELFGHVKGAFTGAHRDRVGRFEMAQGGTLFLDEIGDISLETQVKLLRVLQERSFEPVGGTRTIHVDVRLIAATHQNLEQLIAEGKFREDLYYRLNVISITLPALREREDDVFELALHFLARAAARTGKRITYIDDAAVEALKRYHWPGNIRELENAIERAVVLAEGECITMHDLPSEVLRPTLLPVHVLEAKPLRSRSDGESAARGESAAAAAGLSEREQLLDALQRADGNKAQAARLLGMPRSTFFSKLKKHSIHA